MEVITILMLVVLTALPLFLVATRISKILFGLVLLTIGIFVQIGGITMTSMLNNATNYTLVQTNTTTSFILFLMLTFGSILSIYASFSEPASDDDE